MTPPPDLSVTEREACQALSAAYIGYQLGKVDAEEVRRQAAVIHRLAVEAAVSARNVVATGLLQALQPLLTDVFKDDLRTEHCVYNDLGAMLLEIGDREAAYRHLIHALGVFARAARRGDELASDISAELGTLASLISASTILDRTTEAQAYVDHGRLRLETLPAPSTDDDRPLRFQLAVANWHAARGEVARAEQALRIIEAIPATDPERATQVARGWLTLGTSLLNRRQYDAALAAYRRAEDLLAPGPFRQDLADALSSQAVALWKLSLNRTRSPAWRHARRTLARAMAVRTSAPRALTSSGCDEHHLHTLMLAEEGRLAAAEREHRRALDLARGVWRDEDPVTGDILLAGVALCWARRQNVAAFDLADRVVGHLDVERPEHAGPRRRALEVRAEAQRRLGRPGDAANDLEAALEIEAAQVRAAVGPAWRPSEAALARRGHEALNAFVDALLAGRPDNPTRRRIFARVALSKDLALNALRTQRGGVPPQLRTATLVEDVARGLPSGGAYLEFMVWLPRRAGRLRARWHAPRLLAFVVRADEPDHVQMIPLGAYAPLAKVLTRLGAPGAERRKLADKAFARLRPALLSPLSGCDTVFIAPDGMLHGLPFAALIPQSVDKPRLVALVESAAALVRRTGDGATSTQPLVISAPDTDQGGAYPPLPYALREADLVTAQLEATHLRVPAWPPRAQLIQARLKEGPAPPVLHIAAHAETFAARGFPGAADGWSAARRRKLETAPDDFDRSRLLFGGFSRWASGAMPDEGLDQVSLSANHVADWTLRGARLVTLSVCHGGRGLPQTLESAASLATAARIAGAGAVVAALWPVPDAATADFMTVFYHHIRAGEGAVRALALSQAAFRRDGGAYGAWAGFTIWAGPDDIANRRPILPPPGSD